MDAQKSRYLCFKLGQEEYGIPLLFVKEVIALPEVTRVPQTPSYFLGIMNLRGQVISVIDLRLKLSIKPTESQETSVIICDVKPNSIGIVVDSVNSVISPTSEQIAEKPTIQNQKGSDYITSIYRDSNRLILLLDISKTLSTGDYQTIALSQQAPKKA